MVSLTLPLPWPCGWIWKLVKTLAQTALALPWQQRDNINAAWSLGSEAATRLLPMLAWGSLDSAGQQGVILLSVYIVEYALYLCLQLDGAVDLPLATKTILYNLQSNRLNHTKIVMVL